MWPRVVELMLGAWLAISPLFVADDVGGFGAVNAYVCAALVATASCLAYWEPTRHARALTLTVGLWLTGRAYLVADFPAEPMVQNEFLVGLLLLMFAIVPNNISQPPRSWEPYIRQTPHGPARR